LFDDVELVQAMNIPHESKSRLGPVFMSPSSCFDAPTWRSILR
jgi:hypothetical protein